MRAAPLLLLLAACSSNPEGLPDADPTTCQVAAVYDPAVATAQHALAQGDDLSLVGALDDTIPDVISLELYAGFGPFADAPIAPGTYPIERQYRDCGVCVLIYADFDDGATSQTYLARSGSVTLTEVGERLIGTINSPQFEQVKIDDDLNSQPEGTCAASMTSLTFDAAIER